MRRDASLPYKEPDIRSILVLSSFILALNLINTIFDKLIFCGLLGQILIGVAWGTSGIQWLDEAVEDVIVQLGYLGLILLVFEGGLATNIRSVKANLLLSVAVAITGIALPMALSFVLHSLVNATPLQAFAAGAALCSTSLGTTFTILNASGLLSTRLGTVLSSAAMMDDVVGLVMVQVISNLGESANVFTAVTVVRPLAVSLGLAVAVPLICQFIVQPLNTSCISKRRSKSKGLLNRTCQGAHTTFLTRSIVLIALVTAANYAGTSNLLAAYLAGAAISWWDSEVLHIETDPPGSTIVFPDSSVDHRMTTFPPSAAVGGDALFETQDNPMKMDGTAVYHKYYAATVQRLLKPFFFASIGFAIPIRDMFSGQIIWRGILYTILMLSGKLATGVWLIRGTKISWPDVHILKVMRSMTVAPATCLDGKDKEADQIYSKKAAGTVDNHELQAQIKKANQYIKPPTASEENLPSLETHTRSSKTPLADSAPSPNTNTNTHNDTDTESNHPLSLYPALILGTAMTARGEIGFLIASLAETSGLFASSASPTPSTGSSSSTTVSSASSSSSSSSSPSEIYLIVTWAIVLCTILGPLTTGTLVKRVRRLEEERRRRRRRRRRREEGDVTAVSARSTTVVATSPLGVWGVERQEGAAARKTG